MKKSSLVELSQIADRGLKEEHLGITHFKESGDVYPHDTNGWPVDLGRVGGLGDQRDQGRLAGIKNCSCQAFYANRTGLETLYGTLG